MLLCVAMTTPWNIMDQLKNWARILQDHIDKLTLSAETTKKLQNESKLHTKCKSHIRIFIVQYWQRIFKLKLNCTAPSVKKYYNSMMQTQVWFSNSYEELNS